MQAGCAHAGWLGQQRGSLKAPGSASVPPLLMRRGGPMHPGPAKEGSRRPLKQGPRARPSRRCHSAQACYGRCWHPLPHWVRHPVPPHMPQCSAPARRGRHPLRTAQSQTCPGLTQPLRTATVGTRRAPLMGRQRQQLPALHDARRQGWRTPAGRRAPRGRSAAAATGTRAAAAGRRPSLRTW